MSDKPAGPLWHDYSYNTGRSRPIAVTHCQKHHDEAIAYGLLEGNRPGHSVKFRPSERGHCLTCGVKGRS